MAVETAGTTTGALVASVELSLAEHVVLGLVAEGPTHGFSVAKLTDAGGPLGRFYRVPRPVVYRALDRLRSAGLVRAASTEPGSRGPHRTLLEVTPAGRRALRAWLVEPVLHVRDLRVELMSKLALLERSGDSPVRLIDAQRRTLRPVVASLQAKRRSASGFEQTVAAWRHRTAQAALRLLDDLKAAHAEGR